MNRIFETVCSPNHEQDEDLHPIPGWMNVGNSAKFALDLQEFMEGYDGLSTDRYKHHINKRLIFTRGVLDTVVAVGAMWLLDFIAFYFFPVIKKAFEDEGVLMTQVELNVDEKQRKAFVELKALGINKVLMREDIGSTDFPPGAWYFYIYPVSEEGFFYCEMILQCEY